MFHVLRNRLVVGFLTGTLAIYLLAQAVDGQRLLEIFIESLTRFDLLLLMFGLYLLAFVVRTFCWWYITEMRSVTSGAKLFGVVNASLVLNHILPFKAGEVARPILATRSGMSASQAVASSLVSRSIDFLMVVVLACFIGLHIDMSQMSISRDILLSAFALAGILVVSTVLLSRHSRTKLIIAAIRNMTTDVISEIASIPFFKLAIIAVLSLTAWMFEGMMLFGAARISGVELSIYLAISVTAITIASQILNVTPGGIGVYEAVMSGALILAGIDPTEALLLATFTHGLKYLYTLLVAIPCSAPLFLLKGTGNYDWRDSRELTDVMRPIRWIGSRPTLLLLIMSVSVVIVSGAQLSEQVFALVLSLPLIILGSYFRPSSSMQLLWWIIGIPSFVVLIMSASSPVVLGTALLATTYLLSSIEFNFDEASRLRFKTNVQKFPQLMTFGSVFLSSSSFLSGSSISAFAVFAVLTTVLSVCLALLILRQWISNWKANLLRRRLSLLRRGDTDPESQFTSPIVVIVPVYNEAKTLPMLLQKISKVISADSTILVVDDGSTDNSVEIARQYGASVILHEMNKGLGAALRTGMTEAAKLKPSAAVYIDADLEYDPADIPRLLFPILMGEADYVIGSRFKGQRKNHPLWRGLGNRVFTLLTSMLAGQWLSDGQSGLRAFSLDALEKGEIIHDYNYAQVLTLNLLRKHMVLREVPISYRYREQGDSFISLAYLWRVPVGIARELLSP